MRRAYTTIEPTDTEIEIQRSRFICWLRRVETEDAARAVIDEARSTHWKANHHCTAYVVGADRDVQRSNDDGEPAGTAGRPMLEVLSHEGASDVIAVVTRYFGGIKLGTGGLARAYSDAVAAALTEASRVRRVPTQRYDLTLSHADAGRAEHALRSAGITITDVAYASTVRLSIAVPTDDRGALEERLRPLGIDVTALVPTDTDWTDRPQR